MKTSCGRHYIAGLLSVLVINANCHSQVEKLPARLLNGPDGMVVDLNNNIYIANWGTDGKGRTIVKIDQRGNEAVYADSLASPDGLTLDEKGTLYVSCFASGEIFKIGHDKRIELYASGLDHPSDIKFDNKGNLYISCFGNFDGTKVIKITPAGKQTTFADSMSVPIGLVFDRDENLYVSNFGSGAIFKFDGSGHKTLYAQLSNQPKGYFQYLAFDDNGNLYCPSFGHNCIYKIDKKQRVSKLTLQNTRGTDLALNGPNSIYIKDGFLYFTEFTANSVYRLKL